MSALAGVSRQAWRVVLALALSGALYLLVPDVARAAGLPVRPDLSNVGEATFTISWVTVQPVVGYVKYGTFAGQLGLTAYDVRGQSFVGYTHYVVVSQQVFGGSTYYYAIVSGDTTTDKDTTPSHNPLSVKTGTHLNPPDANYFSGTIYATDGAPAEGVIIYTWLQRQVSSGTPPISAKQSAITDEAGAFQIDVSQARVATTYQLLFTPFSLESDSILYQYDGPNNWLATAQTVPANTTSDGSDYTELQIQLANQAWPTITPTAGATATPAATPTPGAVGTPTPTTAPPPTATPARTPTPIAPPVVATPAPRPTALPQAPTAAPPAAPTARPLPTATPTAFFRPVPGSARPPGAAGSSYPQKSPTAAETPAPSPPAAPSSDLAASPTVAVPPPPVPPGIIMLITVAGILLASGLGLVTMGAVSSLRRRPL